jgi:hypothetical protein
VITLPDVVRERDAPDLPDVVPQRDGSDASDASDASLDVSLDSTGPGPDAGAGTWGAPCGLFDDNAGFMNGLAFAKSGPLLAGAGYHQVKIWRTDLKKEIRNLAFSFGSTPNIWGAAWSPDGSKLATGATDGTFVWDTTTWTSGPDLGQQGAVQYSADGKILALGERPPFPNSGSVTLIGGPGGSWLAENAPVRVMRFSPDSMLLATTGSDSGSPPPAVKMWRLSDHALLWAAPGGSGAVYDFQFTPDGATLILGTQSNVRRLRVSDGADMGSIAQPGTAISSDTSLFANSTGVWRTSDGSFLGTHGLAGTPTAFAPDNMMLASIDQSRVGLACAGSSGGGGDGGPSDAPPAPGGVGPDLARPANGENTGGAHRAIALTPAFVWRPVTGATSYELEVDDSCPVHGYRACDFPSPEIHQTGVVTTSYQTPTALAVSTAPPVGRRYFWRVRAMTPSGPTEWSTVRHVNVGRANFDLNGDGYADTFVQNKIYLGGATMDGTSDATAPDAIVQIVGDVNGDGFADWTSASGTFFGGSPLDVTADLPITGGAAGDLNADGYADLVGSDPTYYNGSISGDDGRAWI